MSVEVFLIGSRAMKAHGLFINREPNDIDLIVRKEDISSLLAELARAGNGMSVTNIRNGKWKVTITGAPRFPGPMKIEITADPSDALIILANQGSTLDFPLFPGTDIRVRVPDVVTLYWIKRSHIEHAIHWQKNIFDYMILTDHLKRHPMPTAELVARSEALAHAFIVREAEVTARHPKPHVNLNVTNDVFFHQYKIYRKVDHEQLHRAVAFTPGQPLFNSLKDNPAMAWCSWDKFQALTPAMQLKAVQEEAMVIALERFLIPGRLIDAQEAIDRALEALATRMWAGEWSMFVVEHFFELRAIPPSHDFVHKARKIVQFDPYSPEPEITLDPVIEPGDAVEVDEGSAGSEEDEESSEEDDSEDWDESSDDY